jgi:hypothetical protein
MRLPHSFSTLGAAFLLVAIATALPDSDSDMNMDEDGPQSYFALGEHSGSILAHIILEVVSWCFILPVGKFRVP